MNQRILIVSSDPDERFLASAVLRGTVEGVQIAEAPDAVAFADTLSRNGVDVAVVSRALDWADGLDVLRLLHRKHPRCVTVLLGDTAPDLTDPDAQPDAHLSRGTAGLAKLGQVVMRAVERAASRSARAGHGPSGIETLPVAVLQLSTDETVLSANGAAAALLGHDDAHDLAGRALSDLIKPAGPAARAPASLCASASTAPSAGLEVSTIPASGVPAACRLVARAQSQDGAITGFVAMLLPQAPAVTHDAENLVFALSHDLQQPLLTTRQSAQMLSDRLTASARLGSEEERMLRRIVTGTARMDSLVSALLEYVRTGQSELTLSRFDLGEVVDEVVQGLMPTLQNAGAVVRWHDLPVIEASRPEIARLVENLVNNAIKFHATGAPEVEISCADRGDSWLLSFRDNGIGIGPGDAERIFEPFERLHTASEYPGTGIGLAICRQICERHGGRIWVTPNSDQGSTFHMTIAKNLHKEGA